MLLAVKSDTYDKKLGVAPSVVNAIDLTTDNSHTRGTPNAYSTQDTGLHFFDPTALRQRGSRRTDNLRAGSGTGLP